MTAPAIILPKDARDKLKAEAAIIRRKYNNESDRQRALNQVLKELRAEYPRAFVGAADADS